MSYRWQDAQKNVRPVRLHDPLHRTAASRRDARLVLPVVDAEPVLEIAELAGGLGVVAQCRATGLDRFRDDRVDDLRQPFQRARGAPAFVTSAPASFVGAMPARNSASQT